MTFLTQLPVVILCTATGGCATASPHAPASISEPQGSAQSAACPRPTDKDGRALYQTVSGAFVSRRTDEGGSLFVLIDEPTAAASQSFRVTRAVYDTAASIERGRRVTLVGYVGSAMSGAEPSYSCIEY